MSDFPRTPQMMKREVSAEGGALWRTLYHLWPYMWPSDRSDLKARVVFALGLLLVAKLATIAVPFTFKWATDSLVDDPARPAWGWVLAVPLTMTAAYGGMRIVMALLTQARDGLFAKVAMNAVRRLAVMTFEHMHQLSLRFHLERKTGGLTRVLERGRNAIETIVRMMILQLIPTIVEVALICVVLLYQFDWRYVLVIFVTVIALHLVHVSRDGLADRHPPQDERERHRRQHQGDRLAAQLRDRQVFRQRGAGGGALTTARWRATSRRASRRMYVARRAQHRPGDDLHHRHDRDDGAHRVRHQVAASRRSAISS